MNIIQYTFIIYYDIFYEKKKIRINFKKKIWGKMSYYTKEYYRDIYMYTICTTPKTAVRNVRGGGGIVRDSLKPRATGIGCCSLTKRIRIDK